ncbi:MAG: hypothetical protein FD141_579 [Fusobacteria bacterium]|nr:MAG: hypothetical protein FD141_579 [Fusobacteriota bacterium]KAF0228755.1 MAG: hypothetical protein FD182_1011 [Fusobacteriota bacterium]
MKNNKFILIFVSIIIIIYGISKGLSQYVISLDNDILIGLQLLYFSILGPIIFYRHFYKGKRLNSIEALKISLFWAIFFQIIFVFLYEISIAIFILTLLISFVILVTGEDDNTDKDKLAYHKIILFYFIPILVLEHGSLIYDIRFFLYLHSLNYVMLYIDLIIAIVCLAIIISSIKFKKIAWWLTVFLMLIIGASSILTFLKNGNSIFIIDIPFYYLRVMIAKVVFSVITIIYYLKVKDIILGKRDVVKTNINEIDLD